MILICISLIQPYIRTPFRNYVWLKTATLLKVTHIQDGPERDTEAWPLVSLVTADSSPGPLSAAELAQGLAEGLWTEQPGELPSLGSYRVGHNWLTDASLLLLLLQTHRSPGPRHVSLVGADPNTP